MIQKEGAQDESKTGEQTSSTVNKQLLFFSRERTAFGMCVFNDICDRDLYIDINTRYGIIDKNFVANYLRAIFFVTTKL